MSVEEVGDECEVQTWIAGDEGRWGEVFTAADVCCVLEDLFGAGAEVACL